MGRPLIEITDVLCKKAESLAAQGLTMDQIAHTLGMGYSTIYEKVNKYTEFSEAIEAGRSKGIAQVTNALFKRAVDGDVSAQKYYLNNRDNDNWKDRIETKSEVTIKEKDPVKRKSRIQELISKTKS